MTNNLFERLQEIPPRPEMPRLADPQEDWSEFVRAAGEHRKAAEKVAAEFFDDVKEGTEQHARRQGLWDRHRGCTSPPADWWLAMYGVDRAAELTRAWLEGYAFYEAEAKKR